MPAQISPRRSSDQDAREAPGAGGGHPGRAVPSLAIVIVNWNSGPQLSDCLRSIGTALTPAFRLDQVVVVDNASTDGSDRVDQVDGVPCTVVRNAVNRGFAAACNQGAAVSPAEYLLFLNPDTRLQADSLAVPIAHLESSGGARVGICGIQLVDDDGEVMRSCARLPTPGALVAAGLGLDRLAPRWFPGHFMIEWPHDTDAEIPQVIGAFFLVRRAVFEALGGFDERFFVYYEEVDFTLRAAQAGWATLYCTHARAFHKGGGTSDQIRAARLFYALRSRLQFARKHFAPAPAAAVLVTTLVLEPWARIAVALRRRGIPGAGETLEGYRMLWRALPTLGRRVTPSPARRPAS